MLQILVNFVRIFHYFVILIFSLTFIFKQVISWTVYSCVMSLVNLKKNITINFFNRGIFFIFCYVLCRRMLGSTPGLDIRYIAKFLEWDK
jgi:hypothetical protein